LPEEKNYKMRLVKALRKRKKDMQRTSDIGDT